MLTSLRRLLLTLLLVGFAVVPTASPAAAACSCAPRGAAVASEAARAVFTGTVVAASREGRTEGSTGGRGARITHEVAVDTVYKGRVSTERVRVETTTGRPASCALGRLAGDQPYVFFVQGRGEAWTAGGCSGTRPAAAPLVGRVEALLGAGRPPVAPAAPETPEAAEPQAAVFTDLGVGEPAGVTRTAAPGLALVLVGLLGLYVVRRLARSD